MISKWTPPGAKVVALKNVGNPWIRMHLIKGHIYTVDQMVDGIEIATGQPDIGVRLREHNHNRSFQCNGVPATGLFWGRNFFRLLITPEDFTDLSAFDNTDEWDRRKVPQDATPQ